MSISFSSKKIVSSYLLISILYFGYNMLRLPKLPYFALRFFLMLIVVVYAFKTIKLNIKNNPNMRLFLSYFIYLIFTFFFIVVYAYPPSLIPEAIREGLFPMFFFFVAIDEKKKPLFEVTFYEYYFWGTIFLFVCSIYLFLTMPSWYIEWKQSMLPDNWAEDVQIMGIMSGFANTGYLVGYTALFSFCYIIFKFKDKLANLYDSVLLFIITFSLIFSHVRVAIFTAVVILFWFFFKILSPKTFTIIVVVGICFFFVFNYIVNNSEWISSMLDIIVYKVSESSGDTRYLTGFNLLSQQTNFIFGHGYGTGGNLANSLGLPSVTDGEYFKLFYETGVIGFSFFAVIIIKTILKIVANKSKYMFELFLIAFYLLAMLVADPLSLSAMMSHVFWFAIGRVLL